MASTFDSTLLPGSARRTLFRRRARRILPQYYTPEYHALWPVVKIALFLTGVLLAMFTGLFVAVGGTLALKFVGFPIGIFTVLILWLLPDVDRPDKPPFMKLLTIYLALMALWPSYIAIVLPGLPWLTPPRIMLAVMLVMMLAHFPQDATSRRKVADLLTWDRWAFRLYVGYICIAIAVLPLARDPLGSFTYGLLQETLALAPMVMAAWLFATVGNVDRVLNVILLGGIASMLIAVLENIMQVPPWVGYVPSFMQIDPVAIEIIYSPQARVGDSRYRIRSVFPVVLYYTQYLNLLLPLFIYKVWRAKGRARVLAWALVPLILHTVWFANARTAFIPLFSSLFGLAGLVLIRTSFFRTRGDSLPGGIMVVLLLVCMGLMGGALATSHRLQMYTFGGAQHAASNDSREKQWENAWSQLAKNPIGVGVGNSPDVVGISNTKTTRPVVDSLWINQLVDIGVLGFVCYFGFYFRLVWIGVQTFLRADGEEEEMAGVLALGVLNFVISAYVISHTDNNYILMVFAIATLALARRQQHRLGGSREPQALAGPAFARGTALATR